MTSRKLSALLLATIALAPFALAGDVQSKRYVGSSTQVDPCLSDPEADPGVGGACFPLDASQAGQRLKIEIVDDFGVNARGSWKMLDAQGNVLGASQFCGSVTTTRVLTSAAYLSVGVYPGSETACPGSAGTGVSGEIFVETVS